MPLELRPLAKDDAHEAARLVFASYEDNPFRKIVFPNGMSQSTIHKIIESRSSAVDDPDKYPLKIVDTETGEMAACAVWEYTKPMSEGDWNHEMEKALTAYPEARQDILSEFMLKEQDSKRRIMGNNRWWDKLEEMKVPGFIVATDQGYGLYIKHGFREVERWEVDMGRWPQWGGNGMYMNVFLTRHPAPPQLGGTEQYAPAQ
ncbi:hypothetical protein OEA41_004609 [Lepraria neglecta]|uniref:N-acetyltransferase domain-containing protein n=1 Tax=Lepraria neglecta TaxID=209136 RepID=A0AAE0DIE6_9LECA|nr:hypothetical protein OEA41_004609 [Lepraria neglecta]